MDIPCLVINLDRQRDKFDIIQKELEDVGFTNIIRIPGVDGKKLPDTGLLPRSLVGCFESHKKCARYILDNNLPKALILEDDALPYPEMFPYDFPTIKGYEMVLYHTHNPYEENKDNVMRILGSAAAYMLTHEGAKQVSELPIIHHYDIQINFQLMKFKEKQRFYTDESSSTNITDNDFNFISKNIGRSLDNHRYYNTIKSVFLRNPITGYEYNMSEFVTIIAMVICIYWFVNLF